jgi:hypothetical protein
VADLTAGVGLAIGIAGDEYCPTGSTWRPGLARAQRSAAGIDIAWIVGLLVTAAVYLVLSRSLNTNAERAATCRQREAAHPDHSRTRRHTDPSDG